MTGNMGEAITEGSHTIFDLPPVRSLSPLSTTSLPSSPFSPPLPTVLFFPFTPTRAHSWPGSALCYCRYSPHRVCGHILLGIFLLGL